MNTGPRIRNALLAQLDSGDTGRDAVTAMHQTLLCTERDYIGAWYRAGLAAGGEPVDWVGWYSQRLRRRPNQDVAQSQLARLCDAEHRAKFQALPPYWQ